MSKKRIPLIYNYYQSPGGEDTVAANEKMMLEKNGHKVFWFSRNKIRS